MNKKLDTESKKLKWHNSCAVIIEVHHNII